MAFVLISETCLSKEEGKSNPRKARQDCEDKFWGLRTKLKDVMDKEETVTMMYNTYTSREL